jgi:arsenate reductase
MVETTNPPEQPSLLAPEALLLRAADDLAGQFVGAFGKETIERYVFDSYTALRHTATSTTHLPNLSVRFARDRLTALAHAEGRLTKDVPEVLFVCAQNAGRSQLAMALTNHHAAGAVHVRSAGTAPAGSVDANVLVALAESGVDAAGQFPKPLTDDVVRAADVVVTTGCGDACPVYPGKRYLDWDLDEPEGKSLARVRAIRDDIDARVQSLLDELGINSPRTVRRTPADPFTPDPGFDNRDDSS